MNQKFLHEPGHKYEYQSRSCNDVGPVMMTRFQGPCLWATYTYTIVLDAPWIENIKYKNCLWKLKDLWEDIQNPEGPLSTNFRIHLPKWILHPSQAGVLPMPLHSP